ncbi:MAG: 5'-methylthioadenosine/adenosylhomocysteine nucleosidase [Desulfobacula sp.]|nr:5'-methylthioadenosine/adenosylhomocysteine nucleosidase [Desulfobacula sp.]
MIGILGALDEEVNLIREALTDRITVEKAGNLFHCGKLGKMEVSVIRCGIGKVNAAICTQILIDRFQCEKIIFGGVAGALLMGLGQGDVVISSHVVQFDIDLTAFGRRHGELANQDRLIAADPGLIEAATRAFDQLSEEMQNPPALMVGTIVSGDSFISDPATIKWLQREFGAACTEMEGGSVGYTCKINGIPFVIIRIMSDKAGDKAVEEFDAFLSKSSEMLCKLILGTLRRL